MIEILDPVHVSVIGLEAWKKWVYGRSLEATQFICKKKSIACLPDLFSWACKPSSLSVTVEAGVHSSGLLGLIALIFHIFIFIYIAPVPCSPTSIPQVSNYRGSSVPTTKLCYTRYIYVHVYRVQSAQGNYESFAPPGRTNLILSWRTRKWVGNNAWHDGEMRELVT